MSDNREEKAKQMAKHIVNLYTEYGSIEFFGLGLSHIEHAIQCALLAQNFNFNREDFIVVALLHDVGHLVKISLSPEEFEKFSGMNHDEVGAKYLQELGFPYFVHETINQHVNAIKYLSTVKPGFYELNVNQPTKNSLAHFGGHLLEGPQLTNFTSHPLFEFIMALNDCDEQSKIIGLKVPSFESFEDLIISVYSTQK